MKNIISIKNFLPVLLSMLVGLFIGSAAGFDPTKSSLVSLGLSMFAFRPAGVASSGIDLTAFTAQLNTYIKLNTVKIWTAIRTGFELAPYLRRVPNVTGEYVESSSTITEIIQGWQSGWTPKGTVSFNAYKSRSRHVKIDMLIDNIDVLYNGWLDFLLDETRKRSEWPFVRFVVEQHLIPKAIEEMNTIACRGSYVAPTTGTAGATINATDGLLTIIANEISASTLTPIVTGSLSSSNTVAKIETFLAGVNTNVLNAIEQGGGGDLLVSMQTARWYKENYRALYGSLDKDSRNNLQLDHYNIRVKGIQGFGTSSRMVLTPKDNMLHLFNKIAMPENIESQLDKRNVCLLADWWMGIGFGTLDQLYVNDQA